MAAGIVAYFNSFSGAFVFDDKKQVLENPRILQLWPPWPALGARRPVVELSLAVNHAIGEFDTTGYHAVNLAVHILAGLTLFGIVRRTLLRPQLHERFASSAPWLALAVALVWVVHPLQTQSVTYIIQRSESMMGLFYLLTLYCAIRGADSAHRRLWFVAAVLSCASSMGSKAVAVTAPIVILLYDRTFLATSFRELINKRWPLYAGLAATWGVLLVTGIVRGLFVSPNNVATVGFAYKGITPLQYAATQPGAILHYLRLALWPWPLCLDYGWPVARSADEIVIPALLLLALVAATIWALVRKPPFGFVGLWFLLILAPTSSIVPIRDPVFEHRMYLPLAAIVVLAVLAAHRVLTIAASELRSSDRTRVVLSSVLLVAVTAVLTAATAARNRDYESDLGMWRDVVRKRPDNPRGYAGVGAVLFNQEGDLDEAIRYLRKAIELGPMDGRVHRNLGTALLERGDVDAAIDAYGETARRFPRDAESWLDLGDAYFTRGDLARAVENYRKAVRLDADLERACRNLGVALMRVGMSEEGLAMLRRAVELDPDNAATHFTFGGALYNVGRFEEAIAAFEAAVKLEPGNSEAQAALNRARQAAPGQQP